jgi:hypothetical protein
VRVTVNRYSLVSVHANASTLVAFSLLFPSTVVLVVDFSFQILVSIMKKKALQMRMRMSIRE